MRPSGCSITCRWPGQGSSSTSTSATCTGRTSASRIEPPRPGNALQLVLAALLEGDPGAGDEVAHRARDEHLARPGERRDARAGVDGDPAHLPVRELALARVQAGAELEPEAAHTVAERAPGVRVAIQRPSATFASRSPVWWMTSVGTMIVGRTARMSICVFMRKRAAAAPGLALRRA